MPKDALLQALERIEHAEALNRSPLMRRVLRHLVETVASGQAARLTAYNVAVEAFGKPPDFDASQTASVRVEMARLRRILAALRAAAPDQPAIDIPSGSYVPRLVAPQASTQQPDALRDNESISPATGPAVVVVGFRARVPPAQQHIGAGLARMVYEELVRFRWLYVVDAIDLDPDMPRLAEHCLGRFDAQFVLRGILTPGAAADSFDATLELLDTTTRRRAWHAPFVVRSAHMEADQQAIAVAIGRELGSTYGAITRAGLAGLGAHPGSGDRAAAELVFRFHYFHAAERTPKLRAELDEGAHTLLERSPGFAMGWTILGALALDDYVMRLRPHADRDAVLAHAAECLDRALSLDPQLARAAFFRATVSYFARDRAAFLAQVEQALALAPNHPEHQHFAAGLLCQAGELARGAALLDTAGLGRHHAAFYRVNSGLAANALGRRDEALRVALSLGNASPFHITHFVQAVCFALNERHADATAALQRACARCRELAGDVEGEVNKWMLDPELAARTLAALQPAIEGVVRA